MMFGSSLPPVVCMMDRVLLTLFVFVCVLWCPTYIVSYICFVFLRLLPVSQDCPIIIL
jgi:hypothetical protein